ncbi:DUF4274 domain-containing protein [Gemelliphila palaticanis]|uniref:DUF4274 domain-containing protein n=1 Tax=Gemelliphila palaticanis TaxID=81950 RepID=A0ABX2T1U3_9BACL|nr:DUF4274 domain-containing protein [Gemella palaticanis]MBF0715693.1 DUF4274 domain-containing protein [Gemella palaticanis]NYS47623.1 DUF4274 domain-containing protein [Gemella palaticanis]
MDTRESLENILLKAEIAGDKYYFNMEKEDFYKAMKGNEEEDFYKEYLKQREMGFEAYKNQVKEEIKQISSSEELHLLAAEYNFDAGNFLSEQIINHSLCDIETAKLIYWLSSPTYIYEKYGSLENCPKEDYICYDDAKFLMTIEEKVKNGVFKTGLIVEKNDVMIAEIEDTDFSTLTYSNIP